MDQGLSVPGVSESDLLAKFQSINANPTATPDDMYGTVMTPHPSVTDYNDTKAKVSALTINNSFLTTGTGMTVADLLATYPPSATTVGKYARVTDLYGSVDEIMRCRYDGTAYRWVPQRESFTGVNTSTSGSLTLTPLLTPPTVRLTGSLLGNISVTPSSVNAYIGQRFRIVNNAVLGIFAATVTGLIGSNLTVAGSGSRDIEYGPTGWFAAA